MKKTNVFKVFAGAYYIRPFAQLTRVCAIRPCVAVMFLLASIAAQAQVSIGSGALPNATLDVKLLPAGEATPNGIIAPNMTGDELKADDAKYGADQNAAIVYATAASSDANVATAKTRNVITPGYYYYDAPNSVWVGLLAGDLRIPQLPVITVQPRPFSWKETTAETNYTGITSTLDPTPLVSPVISVTAVAASSYQWYEVNTHGVERVTIAPGTSNAATYTPDGSKLGMRQYFCVLTNADGSVKSDVARVAVGCGAFDTDGDWLTFMCYNLGATAKTLSAQMTTAGNVYYNGLVGSVPAGGYTDANANAAVFGDLYQWGRIADGHQLRSSPNSDTTNAPSVGPYTDFDTAWASGGSEQVTSASVDYGRFIVNTSSSTGTDKGTYASFDWNANPSNRNTFLWRNYRYANNDPCVNLGDAGVNWRVPNDSEWGSIYRGSDGSGFPAIALANTWQWRAPGTTTDGSTGTAGGFEIKPDGVTTTLFLPAAGNRNSGGQLYRPSVSGYYWSSTTYGNAAQGLYFSSGNVIPAYFNHRAYGFSLRCIAEF